MDFVLFPPDSLIREGSRIELIVVPNLVGNPVPSFEPTSNGFHITVQLDNAYLTLPLVQQTVFEITGPCWENPDRCEPVNR